MDARCSTLLVASLALVTPAAAQEALIAFDAPQVQLGAYGTPPFQRLFDYDGDGYVYANDCNDANANINPGAQEVILNGVDDDCDGDSDEDIFVANQFGDSRVWLNQRLSVGIFSDGWETGDVNQWSSSAP